MSPDQETARPEASSKSHKGSLLRSFWSRDAAPYWLLLGLALTVRLIHHEVVRTHNPLYCYLLSGGDNHRFDRWAFFLN